MVEWEKVVFIDINGFESGNNRKNTGWFGKVEG
jgi:hypothetical protein